MTWIATTFAVLLMAAGAAQALAGGHGNRAHPSAAGPELRPSRVEVASVYHGALSVTFLPADRSVVIARGAYRGALGSGIQDPAFSADGRLVAYLENRQSSSDLHIVRLGSHATVTVGGVRSFSWSPQADRLVLTLATRVELIDAHGAVLRRWDIADAFDELFSPSGRTIAIGSPGLRSRRGSLRLLRVDAGAQEELGQPGCAEPAAWTADGSHLLFWRDPDCSASIAADGLQLDSIATAPRWAPGSRGPRLVNVARTLPYRNWVVPLAGDSVLVNSGGGRVAAEHKSLQRCDAAGQCRPSPLPAGYSTVDPAIAKLSGRLFDVRVPRSAAMNDFLPRGTLWTAATATAPAHELRAAGTGVADPTPSADGSMVFFVHMASSQAAELEALTITSGVVRKLAALDLADYYGEFTAAQVLAIWQAAA